MTWKRRVVLGLMVGVLGVLYGASMVVWSGRICAGEEGRFSLVEEVEEDGVRRCVYEEAGTGRRFVVVTAELWPGESAE